MNTHILPQPLSEEARALPNLCHCDTREDEGEVDVKVFKHLEGKQKYVKECKSKLKDVSWVKKKVKTFPLIYPPVLFP